MKFLNPSLYCFCNFCYFSGEEQSSDIAERWTRLTGSRQVPDIYQTNKLEDIIKLNNQKKKKQIDYEALKKTSYELNKMLKNIIDSIEVRDAEKKRIQFKTESDKIGEVYIFEKEVYIIKDIKNPDDIIKADIDKGMLKNERVSNKDEFKDALSHLMPGKKMLIDLSLLEDLKSVIKEDFKIIA